MLIETVISYWFISIFHFMHHASRVCHELKLPSSESEQRATTPQIPTLCVCLCMLVQDQTLVVSIVSVPACRRTSADLQLQTLI
jgi:hypothetical protein